MNLLETYAKRLDIANKAYAKEHEGMSLSKQRQMTVAMVLNNTNKMLSEAFNNSVGTQRSDLGLWNKFCLNLTTVALPNLIANDLVIVKPMSSMSGYITYLNFTYGSNKGDATQGEVFNNVFELSKPKVNYTSSNVVETATQAGDVVLAWTPVVKGAFKDESGAVLGDVKFIAEDGTVSYLNLKVGTVDTVTVGGAGKVAYVYNNVVIPQNDLPIVNAELKTIPLIAKARRVAIYYSQIAAYQAKEDYGFNLGDQLAEKALGQLEYEIDTEVTNLLIDSADESAELVFNKTQPIGVSKRDHYESFSEIIELAKREIYNRTQRYMPTYMLIASDILPILTFVPGFKPVATGRINGPYKAGTVSGLEVFVTPNIAPGKFIFGVNGNDMQTSAAVYAPYMAIVPTQLLGYADGGVSQGWSTMYALELLNRNLLIAGRVTATAERLVVDTNTTVVSSEEAPIFTQVVEA